MSSTSPQLGSDLVAPIGVQAIDHVTIVVKDLAATRRFYVDVLGMRDVPRPNFSFAGQWFQAGATLIHTVLEHEHSGSASGAFGRSTRGWHIAFLVDDLTIAAARLEASGVDVVVPPKLRPDGAGQMFLHDPDGHLIELCVSPPASAGR